MRLEIRRTLNNKFDKNKVILSLGTPEKENDS